MIKRLFLVTNLAILSFYLQGCGSSSGSSSSVEALQDDPSNTVQSSVGTAGSESSASEGGAVGLMTSTDASGDDFVDGRDQRLNLTSSCSFSSSRSSCTGGSPYGDTIAWNSCTVDGGKVTLTGGWSEVYTGTGASSCTVPVADGGTITRTSSGSVMTLSTNNVLNGATLTTDTLGGTAWDGTVLTNAGSSTARSGSTRTITISGTHKVEKGPAGRTWFDHLIKTTTPLTVTGSRSAGTRTVNGTIVVYHDLLQYTASNAFSGVAWGSSSCCYPTGGSVTTTFTGSVSGTSTLAFTSTCGQATYTAPSGTVSALTLNQCN